MPPYTKDSASFDPSTFLSAWAAGSIGPVSEDTNFRAAITQAFAIPQNDTYGYRATATVTLSQTQSHLDAGARNGLLAWYKSSDGNETLAAPASADVAAYVDIFRPATSTPKALTALASNAKKGSVRAAVAAHLGACYHPPAAERNLSVPKAKAHTNPYLDVWAWSCHALQWCGPEVDTAKVRHSHAVLPVLYHHFGCVCPSYEALATVARLARGRRVVDMGSGNGYWAFMLRELGPVPGGKGKAGLEVVPVDSAMSEWRTVWVGDTVVAEGGRWLERNAGGQDALLLLVYPNTGEAFTSRMIRAYRGTTIVAASSQNKSGFTAFASETIAEWMAREMPDWELVLQIPLPSFAGKDEALFAFEKKGAAASNSA